ncbi:MAG: hypothetical protein KDA81_19155 [Planctomycetaceae bacterium]|nr:hypothetical protein [Planctomycetaceae bacterium]
MPAVTISCPKCQAELKLPDRKLLGRKGKCPKCEHRFVLTEPEEVELQLAEPEPPVLPTSGDEPPMVGTSAKWVPDSQPEPQFPVFPSANDLAPGFPAASFPTPPDAVTGFPVPDVLPAATPGFDFNTESVAPVPRPATGRKSSSRRRGQRTSDPGIPQVPDAAEQDTATVSGDAPMSGDATTAGRGGRRQRKRRRSGSGAMIGMGAAVLFVVGAGWLWWNQNQQRQREAEEAAIAAAPKVNEAWQAEKKEMEESNVSVQDLSPTHGQEIPLNYIAFTPHMILHLRPSEIWTADRRSREFLATLGDLGQWLEQKIRDVTRFEPQEIEELTFALNFGPRTAPPDVAAVVRLRAAQTTSDLQLNRFQGRVRPDLNVQIYESDAYSYMLLDPKTFAVAPVTMSDMLASARDYAPPPPVELEVLVKESDRQRQLTLMFDVTNIDTHREYIFRDEMQHFADEFVLWFGKDIRTISWSMHLGDELYLETLLHPGSESSPLKVQRYIQDRLNKLPEQLQAPLRLMQPATEGYRAMIGRFPAMMRAVGLGTSVNVGPAYVRLVTLLPDKAAANLAAASLYTWNQSVVTDFTQAAPAVAAKNSNLPDKVSERLKKVIIVDFRRTPLQEAFAYIAEEIKTPININGDALKLAGMTQNMPQTYNLGEVSAIKTIDTILSNPDYRGILVVVVDEASKSIIVTTRAVAEQSGLTIYDTSTP